MLYGNTEQSSQVKFRSRRVSVTPQFTTNSASSCHQPHSAETKLMHKRHLKLHLLCVFAPSDWQYITRYAFKVTQGSTLEFLSPFNKFTHLEILWTTLQRTDFAPHSFTYPRNPTYLKASFVSAYFGALTHLLCIRNCCPIVSDSLLYCLLQLTGNSRKWGGLRKNNKTNQENLFHPTIWVFPQLWKTNTPPHTPVKDEKSL